MPAKGVLPLRENCDSNDPEEFALWAFAGMPYVKGAPFVTSIEYFRHVSQRLWDLGFRQVEEPILEYVPPSATDPHWATSGGDWVPAGSIPEGEKQRREIESGIARMGHQQRVEFYQALRAWEAGEELPATKSGQVVAKMLDEQPDLVPIALQVLRSLHDAA